MCCACGGGAPSPPAPPVSPTPSPAPVPPTPAPQAPPHDHDWFFQEPADCPTLSVPGADEDLGEWPFSGLRCTSPYLQAGDYCNADGECGTSELGNLGGYDIYRVVSMPASPSARPETCVPPGSIGQCGPCLESAQCAEGYCCPFKKQCVGVKSCIPPYADCDTAAGTIAEEGQCHVKKSWSETLEGVTFPTSESDVGGPRGLWQHFTCSGGPTPAPGQQSEVSALAWEHFELLNQLREAGHTCPDGTSYGPNAEALQLDCRLWRAAYLHSQDMADRGYFDHETLGTGETPWDRAEEQGISANAENIAMGYTTAEAALEGFKASNGHCNNMMRSSLKLVGVGYAEADGSPRWTQLFSSLEKTPEELDSSCHPSSGSGGGSGRL